MTLERKVRELMRRRRHHPRRRRIFAVRTAHPNDLTGVARRELLAELEQVDDAGGPVRYLIVAVPAEVVDDARRRILRELGR